MKKLKYFSLPIVIPFIFLSCQVRFVGLRFQNKTDNTIDICVGHNSRDSTINYVFDIQRKKDRGISILKQPDLNAKESVTAFVNSVLIKNTQQDTLLYLANKDEVSEYLKGKRKIDGGTFVIKIKEPKK